jgi:outer membrane lipoprotein-sorting protein
MTDGEENRSIAASQFQFTPPDGVDVIDETVQ